MLRQAHIIHRIMLVLVTTGLFMPQLHELLHLGHFDNECREEHSATTHLESEHHELSCEGCSIGVKKALNNAESNVVGLDLQEVIFVASVATHSNLTISPSQRGPPSRA